MDTKINKALLIIDVQKGFINENTKHIPALVEKLQENYGCVLATRFVNEEKSLFQTVLNWHACSPDTEDTELAFQIKENGTVFKKSCYGIPLLTLRYYLYIHNIKEVHLVGLDTDACVYKCALDLFDTGIVPVVLKDYCASSAGKDIHDAALRILERNIGKQNVR